MKKKTTKSRTWSVKKKVLAGAIVLSLALLAYFLTVNYLAAKKISRIEKNLEPFAELLRARGFEDTEIVSECAPDSNIKYGGPVLCGVDVTYTFSSNDGLALQHQFDRLYETIESQDILLLEYPLSENLDKSKYSSSTSSGVKVENVETSCSLTLELLHVPPGNGSVDFRAGCGFRKYPDF